LSTSKHRHLNVRAAIIGGDLWGNKARSLLIVLAVAVGVAAFGLMISGRVLLEENLKDVYAATNPAHTILVLQHFDDGLVGQVRDLPYVQEAQARMLTQARVETSPGKWLSMDLTTVPDFETISIDRLTPVVDAPAGSILLEQSLQSFANIGDRTHLQMLNGDEHTLGVAGFVNDLSILPVGISLISAGYVSPETAQALDLPAGYNRLYVRFKDASSRADIERKLTMLTDYLEREGYLVLSAQVPEPNKYLLGDNMTSVLFILGSIGVLTLILSGLLVTSVMSAVITEQIPQIGILKSLGARFRQIMAIYFQQVLAFGLAALALAIPLGLIGAYFLALGIAGTLNFHVTHFYLPISTVGLQAVSALLIPLLASSIPIVIGARITIHQATSNYSSGDPTRVGWPSQSRGGLPQLINISLRNAFRRKWRLALTFAALILGGAMFIAILGIRQSLHQAVKEIQGSMNYDVGVNFDRPYPVRRIIDEALKVQGVSVAETWLIADGRLVFEPEWLSGSIVIQGVPADTTMARPGVISGRWLNTEDNYALFVNSDFLALSPGLQIGSKVNLRIGGIDHEWTIVGVSARQIIPTAYAHYQDLAAVMGLQDFANRLVVNTQSSSSDFQSRVQTDLAMRLDPAGLQVTGTNTTTETKESSAAQLDTMIILLMSMVILVAIVGGLGLAITMGLNVLERTREIGILRTLGARSNVIRQVVVVEGLIIASLSWAAAIPLSVPLAIFLGNSLGISLLARPLDYTFSAPAVLLWLGLVLFIAVAASLIPAQNAARLTIRDTLVYE
jgi:putative ABC transport system permease protein